MGTDGDKGDGGDFPWSNAFDILDKAIGALTDEPSQAMRLDVELENLSSVHPLTFVSHVGVGTYSLLHNSKIKTEPLRVPTTPTKKSSGGKNVQDFTDAYSFKLLAGLFHDRIQGSVVYRLGDLAYFTVGWHLVHDAPQNKYFVLAPRQLTPEEVRGVVIDQYLPEPGGAVSLVPGAWMGYEHTITSVQGGWGVQAWVGEHVSHNRYRCRFRTFDGEVPPGDTDHFA